MFLEVTSYSPSLDIIKSSPAFLDKLEKSFVKNHSLFFQAKYFDETQISAKNISLLK